MATDRIREYRRFIHPVHAVLLASGLPLFLGALLSDWAYANSFQVQWVNFAAWLIAGALIVTGFALLWAAIDALRADAPRGRRKWIYVGLLGATVVLGFVNALVHAKDAWATMPGGLILSVIVFFLALASVWAGFSGPGMESRNEV
ncbi:MAG: hypothetical protein M3R03_10650 [Pseudomonadota bacterium]|nr:hypothetical protein [Pseudomonadota bacterium]